MSTNSMEAHDWIYIHPVARAAAESTLSIPGRFSRPTVS
jgi:hypothetical protein